MREIKVYCPKCRWVPRPSDLWMCVPACRRLWHTFDTCGVCPRCGKNWEDTQCHACQQFSPHIDWYHESGGNAAEQSAAAGKEAVAPTTGAG